MDRSFAEHLLAEAGNLNPGAWIPHCRFTARAAEGIARRCELNPDLAYTLGLLHDIGRRFGVCKIRHSYEGFCFLNSLGYPVHARICITHSYNLKDMAIFDHQNDYLPGEQSFVSDFIHAAEYDDYDRLIQLSDCLALPDRVCRLEDRIADILSRTENPNELFRRNLHEKYRLLEYFREKSGSDLEFLYRG